MLLEIFFTVATYEWCTTVVWSDWPRENDNVWITVVFLDFFILSFEGDSSKISWASLTNEMDGSLRLNKAQDLDLKLIPWKQAKEIWDPRSSKPPPNTDPISGSLNGKV